MYEEHAALKRFLHKHLYQHDKVLSMTDKAKIKIEVLFQRYMARPAEMPEEFGMQAGAGDERSKARVVADYIANSQSIRSK